MKEIKIIEGKIFIGDEITVNTKAPKAISRCFIVDDLILSVEKRIKQCLHSLMYNMDRIYEIESDHIWHNDGAFVISSYEAMQSLLLKLKDEQKQSKLIDIIWIKVKLTASEADQLFKATVVDAEHFGIKEMMLLETVLEMKQGGKL